MSTFSSVELRDRPQSDEVTAVLSPGLSLSTSRQSTGAEALPAPSDPSPPRQPNSVRRTSTTDITIDAIGSMLTLHGSARDLATDRDLRARVVATAQTEVIIDLATRTISSISATPHLHEGMNALVGLPAGSGFRKAVRRDLPELSANGSLLGLLLDEVPVAMVIAGSLLRRRPDAATLMQGYQPPLDVCAGWARDGLLATTALATGGPPLGEGPVVSAVSSSPDEHAWHPVPALPAWSMRRARRLDVRQSAAAGGSYELDTFFRDSRVTDGGVERGVHEYRIRAVLDNAGTVVDISAVPHVLPAPECPAAAASARRLVGIPLRQVRAQITSTFLGTSTCTHLNDALRVLGDLESLIDVQAGDNGWMRRG